MTFDVTSNSPREYKAIWKENLAVYQKSLRAFFQAPLIILYCNSPDDYGNAVANVSHVATKITWGVGVGNISWNLVSRRCSILFLASLGRGSLVGVSA